MKVQHSLSEAMLVWTGFGTKPFPSRDESCLVERFGADAATQLLPLLRLLEDDFYSSDARHIARGIQEMRELSTAEFRNKHPEVADEIVQALAWCYTYDFK